MLKQIILVSAAALLAFGVQASTLYWQVDTTADGAQVDNFSAAILKAYNKGTGESTTVSAVMAQGVPSPNLVGTTTGLQQSDISDYASDAYSFFIELMNFSDSTTKSGQTFHDWNGAWNYNDLVTAGYVSTGSIGLPSYAVGGGVNFGVGAPEPTSGLLMLFGGALLALRRRRR